MICTLLTWRFTNVAHWGLPRWSEANGDKSVENRFSKASNDTFAFGHLDDWRFRKHCGTPQSLNLKESLKVIDAMSRQYTLTPGICSMEYYSSPCWNIKKLNPLQRSVFLDVFLHNWQERCTLIIINRSIRSKFLNSPKKADLPILPWKLTCSLKIDGWKMNSLLKWSLSRGHGSFQGCTPYNKTICSTHNKHLAFSAQLGFAGLSKWPSMRLRWTLDGHTTCLKWNDLHNNPRLCFLCTSIFIHAYI